MNKQKAKLHQRTGLDDSTCVLWRLDVPSKHTLYTDVKPKTTEESRTDEKVT